jgi:hypothetical protein
LVGDRRDQHCVASQHLANEIRHFLNLPDFHSDAMFPVRRLGRVICGSSSTAALKNNQLVTNRADGEVDFVGQRGGQFSHHADAVHVREIRLQLTAD